MMHRKKNVVMRLAYISDRDRLKLAEMTKILNTYGFYFRFVSPDILTVNFDPVLFQLKTKRSSNVRLRKVKKGAR